MEYILGVAVSLLVQWLKKYSANEWVTLAILLAVSLGAAAIYTTFLGTVYWQTIVATLTTAGAFYAFVLQRFEGSTPTA